jgi:hypothetical protein
MNGRYEDIPFMIALGAMKSKGQVGPDVDIVEEKVVELPGYERC